MKNFVPRDEPQVPLLMSADNGPASCADDELDVICNDLLTDDQPQLSPLTSIDKSALVVGMSHDIDDVVDSVICGDDLPPFADLTELAVLPPPSLSPATMPLTTHAATESVSMPKLSSDLNVPPGLMHVNSEFAVLVRLRRLSFHRYCSPDARQRVDLSSDCLQSLNVTSMSETACRSLSAVDETCTASCMSVKQEPDQSTSQPTVNGPVVSELHKSVSVKHWSGSEKLPVVRGKCAVQDITGQQSPVVVLTGLTADALRSASGVLCSQVELKSQRPSQSSSVKRKTALLPHLPAVKKQRTDTAPAPPRNKLSYVSVVICALLYYYYNNYYNRFTALSILSGTTCVSRYQKKHSPTYTLLWSSIIPYLLPPSITTHCILPVLFTCLAVFLHSLQIFFGLPLGLAPSTSYSIHSPNHCPLFACLFLDFTTTTSWH